MADGKAAARYYTHPELPAFRDVDKDDPSALAAGRYGYVSHGARGQRVLIRQDPGHRPKFREGARKSRNTIPLTAWHADEPSHIAALESVQGQPYWFVPYCTYVAGAKSRTEANIQDLTGMPFDIDWHDHPEAKLAFPDAAAVWERIQLIADENGLPPLNGANLTGRGLLVAYRFAPVPAYRRGRDGTVAAGALSRYRIVKAYLFHLFSGLTADRSTLQPGHYYKVPGSVNVKSGTAVRVIREPEELYCFNLLCNAIMPKARAAYMRGELDGYSVDWPKDWRDARRASAPVDIGVARALRTGRASVSSQRTARRDGTTIGDPLVAAQVIWAPRLAALVALGRHWAAQSGGKHLPPGQRHELLFLIAVALSWLAPSMWSDEFLRIAGELTDLTDADAMDRVCHIAKLVAKVESGETVTYGNRQVDVRYRFRSDTIIGGKWLGLTAAETELPFLSCLAPAHIQKAHKQSRATVRRRTVGRIVGKGVVKPTTKLDRSGYLADVKARAAAARADGPLAARATQARSHRDRGMATRAIASVMGCSEATVRRLLRQAPSGPAAVEDAAVIGQAKLLYVRGGCEATEIAEMADRPVERVRRWPAQPHVAAALAAQAA